MAKRGDADAGGITGGRVTPSGKHGGQRGGQRGGAKEGGTAGGGVTGNIIGSGNRVLQVRKPRATDWTQKAQAAFLAELAMTANVTTSVAVVGMSVGGAYNRRARDPAFAAEWEAALLRGYERLEELLLATTLAALDRGGRDGLEEGGEEGGDDGVDERGGEGDDKRGDGVGDGRGDGAGDGDDPAMGDAADERAGVGEHGAGEQCAGGHGADGQGADGQEVDGQGADAQGAGVPEPDASGSADPGSADPGSDATVAIRSGPGKGAGRVGGTAARVVPGAGLIQLSSVTAIQFALSMLNQHRADLARGRKANQSRRATPAETDAALEKLLDSLARRRASTS